MGFMTPRWVPYWSADRIRSLITKKNPVWVPYINFGKAARVIHNLDEDRIECEDDVVSIAYDTIDPAEWEALDEAEEMQGDD